MIILKKKNIDIIIDLAPLQTGSWTLLSLLIFFELDFGDDYQ